MAEYENVPMDREPSLRDRISKLEALNRELNEHLAELDAVIKRLAREIGLDT